MYNQNPQYSPKKLWLSLAIVIIASLFIAVIYNLFWPKPAKILGIQANPKVYPTTFWDYQCIDTMKYSRDTARAWDKKPEELQALIVKQMEAMKDLGANCVAIGTPYDEEFVPFMKAWLKSARFRGLKIWFRGNVAGFEGWFNYPKLKSNEDHHTNIYNFVTKHPELFQEGDIFTPSPETENTLLTGGWTTAKANTLKTFLVDSQVSCDKAFKKINKKVICGYFSSNGNVAEDLLTPQVVKSTGGVVVIDHYVKTAARMEADIKTLKKKHNAYVAIGEFGVPIPDIHGKVTDAEKAKLIEEFLYVFYKERKAVRVINYWTLTGGSTALYSDDLKTASSATQVIKKYFRPGLVSGVVTDEVGNPLVGIPVSINKGGALAQSTLTDQVGGYGFLIPAGTASLEFGGNGFAVKKVNKTLGLGSKEVLNIALEPIDKPANHGLKMQLLNLESAFKK